MMKRFGAYEPSHCFVIVGLKLTSYNRALISVGNSIFSFRFTLTFKVSNFNLKGGARFTNFTPAQSNKFYSSIQWI